MINNDQFHKLLAFLRRLDSANLAFSIKQCREEAIMVFIDVPGERWEVEFMEDDTLEIEVFKSDGTIHGDDAVEDLFKRHSD